MKQQSVEGSPDAVCAEAESPQCGLVPCRGSDDGAPADAFLEACREAVAAAISAR